MAPRVRGALLVVGLLGAALGAAPARAAATAVPTGRPMPEACSMLSSRAISAVLGQPVGPARASSVPGVCDWALTSGAATAVGSVHALVQRGDDARHAFRRAKRFHAGDREPVSGLGRAAFLAPGLGTIWVLHDRSTVFYVQRAVPSGLAVDPAELRAQLLALAGIAEARIAR